MKEEEEGQESVWERARVSDDDSTYIGHLKSEFKLSNFGLSHPQPRLLVSSQWGYPRLYLGWRVFWAVYHVSWILFDWVNTTLTSERPLTWPIYLTNWEYTMLTSATVSLAALQVYVTRTGKDFKEMVGAWYLKMTWLLYTISSNAALLISVLFFALLFDGDWKLTSIVTHLLSSVYVMLDFCVTATPLRFLHLVYPFTFSSVYLAFNVVYWAARGVNEDGKPYIYKPLDWSKPGKAAPLAVGVLVAAVPFTHLFLWSLYRLKVFVWKNVSNTTTTTTTVRGGKEGGGGGGGSWGRGGEGGSRSSRYQTDPV